MKKTLFTLAIVLLALAAQAQFKVHSDNWVSIGSSSGSYGLQVTPNGYTYFRTLINTDYSRANLSMANTNHQKHWIVLNLYNTDTACYNKSMFYVLGNGCTYSKHNFIISNQELSDDCLYSQSSESVDSEEALSTILNLTAHYYEEEQSITAEEIENNENIDREAVEGMIGDLGKRIVALSAKNLSEVFPNAVRTDSEARLCIDYNAVVTMLVEAVKQQQAEIELLRTVLEENGLMEPKNP